MANYMTKKDCIERGVKALNKIEFLTNEQRDRLIQIIGAKYRSRLTLLKTSRTYSQLWDLSHNLMIWAIEGELERINRKEKDVVYKLRERYGKYVIENLVSGVESDEDELENILDNLNGILKIIEINEMKNDIQELYEVAEEIKEVKENIKNEGLDVLIDYRKVIKVYDTELSKILSKNHNQFSYLGTAAIVKKYNEDLLKDLNDSICLDVIDLKEYLNELLIAYSKVSKKQTDTNILGLIKEYNENDGRIDSTKFEDPEAIVDIMNSENVGVMYDRNNKIIVSELPF